MIVTNDHLAKITEELKKSTPEHDQTSAHLKNLATGFGGAPVEPVAPVAEQKYFGVDMEEFKNDILGLKKQGYTIEQINDVIDQTPEITDKDAAKKSAADIFDEKNATMN